MLKGLEWGSGEGVSRDVRSGICSPLGGLVWGSAGAGRICCSLKGCQWRSLLGLGLKQALMGGVSTGVRGSREGLAGLEATVGGGGGAKALYRAFGGGGGCGRWGFYAWVREPGGDPGAWLTPISLSFGSTGVLAWLETRGLGNTGARPPRGPFKRLRRGPFKGRDAAGLRPSQWWAGPVGRGVVLGVAGAGLGGGLPIGGRKEAGFGGVGQWTEGGGRGPTACCEWAGGRGRDATTGGQWVGAVAARGGRGARGRAQVSGGLGGLRDWGEPRD